ncbi:MAG: hypothetical protein ACR2RB_11645, partial [Gammaproteobacteria bacterium]
MSIIDNMKEIASVIKELDNVDLYRKIVELEGETIELIRVNRELEDRLSSLQRNQGIIAALDFDSPFFVNAEGSELFCT